MKRFNVKKALKGKPVRLLNGRKAYVLHKLKRARYLPRLLGYVITERDTEYQQLWHKDGRVDVNGGNTIIGMWED